MRPAKGMIRVTDLHKVYGPVVALDGISFEVDRGEVLGFLGPNGGGKTTTMKILTGYLSPTSGRAWIAGREVGAASDPRSVVGYLPEHAPVYPELTVDEYLAYVSRVRAVARKERRRCIERAVDRCGLDDMRRRPLGALSKGFRHVCLPAAPASVTAMSFGLSPSPSSSQAGKANKNASAMATQFRPIGVRAACMAARIREAPLVCQGKLPTRGRQPLSTGPVRACSSAIAKADCTWSPNVASSCSSGGSFRGPPLA